MFQLAMVSHDKWDTTIFGSFSLYTSRESLSILFTLSKASSMISPNFTKLQDPSNDTDGQTDMLNTIYDSFADVGIKDDK